PAQMISTILVGCAMVMSFVLFFTLGDAEVTKVTLFRFIEVGDIDASWVLRLDLLSAVMLVVVTTVSFLVHLYSFGYMADDDDRAKFFSYLSLFTFAMLSLVTADNFLQMFFGWEGVGLASYLLIGFYYKKESANAAAMKAFVVNRVGDVGYALGIFLAAMTFGSISFDNMFAKLSDPSFVDAGFMFLGINWPLLELMGVLLFIGAMGKSAQLLLHTWLPDAMEGPTPVSALIHAATMVTAGVFLVCRMSPLYELTDFASGLITFVGATTCLYAATVALAQNDIKRVIAFSTCSQLGYMFFAAGVGAYQVAMFHLFTHAFFKALLFLGAGSVIHAMHHQQDMRSMGGLSKILPHTYAMMLIGTIAITGLGIPGTPIGFAGFFSKDAVIEVAHAASGTMSGYAFWVGIMAAFLTALYSWRLIFMTFHGEYRMDKHDYEHAHEAPRVMLIPLYLLAFGAVFAGILTKGIFFGHGDDMMNIWDGIVAGGISLIDEAHEVAYWVKVAPFVVSVAGLLVAWNYYMRHPKDVQRWIDDFPLLHRIFTNKWYFDELYQHLFVNSLHRLGMFFRNSFEVSVDRFGPDGIGNIMMQLSGRFSSLQSGFLFHYALAMICGVVLLLGLAIYLAMSGISS
ncbi:MAG TPA: NADH-quinone oxidoreductase subunit L, partial [Alphaproteobacteria bacterium]|nr:NADH-quinone oxidoreductase subunit L [Alphaproteobacteria bacterium]